MCRRGGGGVSAASLSAGGAEHAAARADSPPRVPQQCPLMDDWAARDILWKSWLADNEQFEVRLSVASSCSCLLSTNTTLSLSPSLSLQVRQSGLVVLGTLILWLGWFGFNGGSQLAIDGIVNADAVAKIFVNTNTAAAGGLLSAMILSKLWLGKTALNATTNGALAGLVVITADPLTPSPEIALLYGAMGGLLIPFAMSFIEKKGIDDPVGAISVHVVAGILGLMLVPILNTGASFQEQAIGTLTIFTFVFGTSYLLWWILDKTVGIRVGEQEEVGGSDMWEAGSKAYPYFMKGHGEED